MKQTSYYTPKCIQFKQTFKGLPCISTFEIENCDETNFDGSVYLNNVEFISICETQGEYMVFINNPGCPIDEKGCPVFSQEHPNQQMVFGYYKSWKRALNKALSIAKHKKYPKPIEIW